MAERLPEEAGPDLRDYWRILVQGRWYILLSLVVVVAATSFFTFTADPVYQAAGRLLVVTGGNVPTSASEENAPGFRNDVPNWMEMITSRSALEKAVAHLEADPQFAELLAGEKQSPSWWEKLLGRASQPGAAEQDSARTEGEKLITVGGLKGRVSVASVRGTDLIDVKATGDSPREAQLISNALLQAVVELDREVTRQNLSLMKDFLEGQVQKTEQNLRALEEEFAKFQREAREELNLSQSEQTVAKLEEKAAELEVERIDKRTDLKGLERQLAEAKHQLLEEPPPPDLSGPDQEELSKLRQAIAKLEEERLLALNEGDYRRAQELEASILSKGQALQGLLDPAIFPQYEQLIRQQRELHASIAALQRRAEDLQEYINRERGKLEQYQLSYNRYERDIQIAQELHTMLREEYEKARIADVGELGGIRVVGWAESGGLIKPNKKRNLLLGALVGLMLGTGIAFLREYLDNTYKTPKQVERDLGISGLGAVFELPPDRQSRRRSRADQIARALITHLESKDPFVNAHIGIEASLRFVSVDRPLKSLLVTSATLKEGKSSLVANLGLVFAHAGRSIVIVDSDLRKPIFYRIFGLDRQVGLANVVLGEAELEEALIRPYATLGVKAAGRGIARTLLDLGKVSRGDLEEALKLERQEGWQRGLEEILIEQGKLNPGDIEEAWAKRREGLENFYVLPPGPQPPNPTDLLGSERLASTIEQLKERFDVVLFDSPPVTVVPDATVLSSQVDGTILLIQAEATNRDMVRQAVEQLDKAGAHVVGAVLNQVKKSTSRYYSGYYGYGYYYYGYSYYGDDDTQS